MCSLKPRSGSSGRTHSLVVAREYHPMKSIIHVIVGAVVLAGIFSPKVAQAEPPALHPNAAVPGATLSISGKGFGPFKSTRYNQVMFGGAPALIQRWEPDL